MNKALRSAGFYIILLAIALVAWAVQFQWTPVADLPVLAKSYSVNTILAAAIYFFLFRFRHKHTEKLGFLFLAGSGIKFLAFFLFFYVGFREDGHMSRSEFLIFFVPYVITSLVETVALVRVLNRGT